MKQVNKIKQSIKCIHNLNYLCQDLNVWDLAAGSLIIEEAGGKVTDVHGNPFTLTTRNFVGTNGHIHTELLERLQKAKMWIE